MKIRSVLKSVNDPQGKDDETWEGPLDEFLKQNEDCMEEDERNSMLKSLSETGAYRMAGGTGIYADISVIIEEGDNG